LIKLLNYDDNTNDELLALKTVFKETLLFKESIYREYILDKKNNMIGTENYISLDE